MVNPELFIKTLQAEGINFFAGVPDSLLKNVCAYITDNVSRDRNIITANEGAAVGVAAGHYLATGGIPLVYMQNSGIGNAVNPLLSLADEKVYSIPMIVMIGWRGEPGVHDEPQHVKQGAVTLSLLDAMEIPWLVLPEDDNEARSALDSIVSSCRKTCKPHAIVIRKGTFGPYNLQTKVANDNPVCREDAMKCVVENIPSDSIIVSTTGKLSRELYEYRDEKGMSHESDFLTVGSMGHSSSIALGLALAKPGRKVFCFDGDGAFIMHMGAISNIGNLAPKNYIHVLFNNGTHESVGGQPTLGFDIDVPAIALACGYRKALSVSSPEDIRSIVSELIQSEGPSLLEIKVGIKSREDLGRPKTTPVENKEAFMKFIQNGQYL
ncbi:MAG: phosphonopyruvate decarboxylase [Muribaculaceae bacterium]|nr:phosphonopyruvate decarboxylase [Muribaculaceae bacterium]